MAIQIGSFLLRFIADFKNGSKVSDCIDLFSTVIIFDFFGNMQVKHN
jgi:hypothetical protein